MTNTFILNTQSEWLKTKRTAAIWFTICAAGFLPALHVLILLGRPDIFVPRLEKDAWLTLFTMVWRNGAAIILPIFVIMINNLIVQIEYRNNTWKQVYATPRSYADIYYSRYLVVHFYLISFFLLTLLFMLLAGLFVEMINGKYHFTQQSVPASHMLEVMLRLYIGVLGVSAIQYWLSMRFRNFIVPLGVGIGLWITGLLIADWENVVYYPYMYSMLLFSPGAPGTRMSLSLLLTNSFVCFAIAVVLGFIDIRMRKER